MKAQDKAQIKIPSKKRISDEVASAVWDVIVIGGGPSGMMAAAGAAKRGKKVLLLEKNDKLGKKLLITGGGRCNVTNAEFDQRILLSKFKDSDKFLFSAFSQYGVQDALDFFHAKKMQTKVEAEKRAFPITDKAQSVWDVLVQELAENKVTIVSEAAVSGIIADAASVKGARLASGQEVHAASVIVATGGTSRPETGSTGDAYAWLSGLELNIIRPTPSLVPVRIRDAWVKRLQGVTMPDVKITVLRTAYEGDADSALIKEQSKKGKILFTHFGISGPTVLNMSKAIGEHLKYSDVFISLDILPQYDHGQLNVALQNLFKEQSNKKIKNALDALIPSTLVEVILQRAAVDLDTPCNSVTREDRLALIETMKQLRMEVEGLLGTEKAIITSGGLSLEEVDFKTMQTRKISGLYVIGDMLNIDRPSGGFSLQLCWTTGFVAGQHA